MTLRLTAPSKRLLENDKMFRVTTLKPMIFRSMRWLLDEHTLQKFSTVHAWVHNHFNQERHLVSRDIYKARRYATLAEWKAVLG